MTIRFIIVHCGLRVLVLSKQGVPIVLPALFKRFRTFLVKIFVVVLSGILFE